MIEDQLPGVIVRDYFCYRRVVGLSPTGGILIIRKSTFAGGLLDIDVAPYSACDYCLVMSTIPRVAIEHIVALLYCRDEFDDYLATDRLSRHRIRQTRLRVTPPDISEEMRQRRPEVGAEIHYHP